MNAKAGGLGVAPVLPMLWRQTWAGLLVYLRIPAFSATSLALPAMFWLFFGLQNAHQRFADGTSAGVYLLCSFGAYAVSSVMVFSFGIGVANQRAQKVDVLQRATPLPPLVAIVAQVLQAMVFALAALLVLFVFAALTGGISLSAGTWLSITARLLFGSLPMVALGMAIGYSAGANAAPGVANLVYLPMAFASGLFIPIDALPEFVRSIAPYLPTYHYGQLAYGAIGHTQESASRAVLWLALWTLILFGLASRAYRREQLRKFA